MTRRSAALAGLLVSSVGLMLAVAVMPYQIDDAFITYRYADHLVTTGEPVFNTGDPRVEGFTSPAWLILLSLGAWLLSTDALPQIGALLGLISLGLVLMTMWCTAAAPDPQAPPWTRAGALISLALTAFNPAASFYAASGLEPLLFLAVVLAVSGAASNRLPLSLGLAACFVAVWVRPEALVLPGLVVMEALGRREWPCWIRWRRLAGAFAIGTAALFLTRWAVFGQLLPNTYYAKLPSWEAGAIYVWTTLTTPWALTVLVLGVLGAWLGGSLHRGYLSAAVGWMVVVIVEGGDWMPIGRMLIPAFAFLALAGGGLAAVTVRRRGAVAVLLVLTAALGVQAWQGLSLAYVAKRSYLRVGETTDHLLDWLSKSGARSIALIDIGRLGFLSEVEIFDLAGLTDSRIARSSGGLMAKDFDLAYLFEERRPDVVLLRLPLPRHLERRTPLLPPWAPAGSPIESRVASDPRLRTLYFKRFALVPDYEVDSPDAKMVYLSTSFRPLPAAEALLPAPGADGVSVVYLPDPAADPEGASPTP